MATSIGSLAVNLTAGTAAFTSGLNKASKVADSFASGIANKFSGIGAGITASLDVGAILGSFKQLVSDQFELIDVNTKLADRLGITSEMLIGLQHAANLAGVGNEEFGKDMEKMAKNLGNAALNGGPLQETLQSLGLDATKLANQGLDESFLQISDAISKVQNPAERAKYATDIFGKSGQALINTISGGSKAIRDLIAETKLYGTSISDIDGKKVEAANDAWTRAQEVVRGAATQVAVGLAPLLERATMLFVKAATESIDFGSIATNVFQGVAKGAVFAAQCVDTVTQSFKAARIGIAEGFGSFLDWMKEVSKSSLNIGGAIAEKMGFSLEKQQKLWGQGAEAWKGGAEILKEEFQKGLVDESIFEKTDKFFKEVEMSATAAAKAAADAAKQTAKVGEAADAVAPGQKQRAALKNDAQKVIDAAKSPAERLGEELLKLRSMLDEGLINDAQFNAAAEGIRSKFDTEKGGKMAAPSLALAGSQEALQAVNKGWNTQNNEKKTFEQMLKELQEQSKLQREQAKKTGDAAFALTTISF